MTVFSAKKGTLAAVANGRAIALSEVPDEAFSSGMLGCGFAVLPSDGRVCSPTDGTVVGISRARHAYLIRSLDGLDILVHIGIDTVKLNGEGISPLVREGDRVSRGDAIALADTARIAAAGCYAAIPVVISNSEATEGIRLKFGRVEGGRDTVLTYKITAKKEGAQ